MKYNRARTLRPVRTRLRTGLGREAKSGGGGGARAYTINRFCHLRNISFSLCPGLLKFYVVCFSFDTRCAFYLN